MSEEEMLEILNNIEFYDYEYTYKGKYHNINTEKVKKALKDLIDLYNKEKEKNIPLIIDEKSINEYADELEDILKINDGYPIYLSRGERQAIHILSHYCRHSIPKSEIKENYISKDKIKERIKELEIMRDENADEIKRSVRFYSIFDSYNLQIEELKELLEK